MGKVEQAMKDPVYCETPTFKDGVGANDPGIMPRTSTDTGIGKSSSDDGKPYSYSNAGS